MTQRRCDGRDPMLHAADLVTPCACGLVFDDADRLMTYPHPWIRDAWGSLIGADLADMARDIPAERRRLRGPVNPTLWLVPVLVVLAALFAFAMARLLEAAAGCR